MIAIHEWHKMPYMRQEVIPSRYPGLLPDTVNVEIQEWCPACEETRWIPATAGDIQQFETMRMKAKPLGVWSSGCVVQPL